MRRSYTHVRFPPETVRYSILVASKQAKPKREEGVDFLVYRMTRKKHRVYFLKNVPDRTTYDELLEVAQEVAQLHGCKWEVCRGVAVIWGPDISGSFTPP